MKIIIYDNAAVRSNILPLSYTRPLGALRIGIDTIAEKWQAMLTGEYLWSPAADYLAEIFPSSDDADALYVAGHIIPDKALAEAVASLRPGQKLMCNHEEVAHYGTDATDTVEYCGSPDAVHNLYDIFMLNNKAVEADFERITAGRQSLPLSPTNTIIGDASKIFIEEGARVEGAFLNTCAGPIYIGRDAEIMEGSMLRGPIALCEHAVVNMGTKIYPGTTLGPYCKV